MNTEGITIKYDTSSNEVISNVEKISTINEKIKTNDTIKHIVISGGGIIGFAQYGVLRESNLRGLWSFENIESIYGTSIGSILGVFLSLKFEWSVLDDYIIKRPWQNVINFTMYSIIQSFESRGILNIKIIEDILTPVLRAKNIDTNVTMREFYELTDIELHIFVTELNNFNIIDICYIDFPDWKLVDAVYASCSIPIIFAPLLKDSKCYIDGGFILNYPLYPCIQSGKDPNEILGICQNMGKIETITIDNNSTLFDFIFSIFNKITVNILNNHRNDNLKYGIVLNTTRLGIYDIFEFASSKEKRIEMVDYGVNQCIEFISTIELK
jgi:predicted acylesterase/phospholipase RssA